MGLQIFFNSRKKDKPKKEEKAYPGFFSRILSNVLGKIIVYIIILVILIFFFDYVVLILQWLIFRWI